MSASQPRHNDDSPLLELPQELSCKVWRELDCSKACHNLMVTSQRTQALMGPAVSSLEFTLQPGNNQWFRGLHPTIQPSFITIKAPLAEEQSLNPRDHGAYDRSACHAAFRLFVLTFISSPHFRQLDEVIIKVCLCVCASHCAL
jgi:hypothetical protein